ncbi:MAG: molybdenum cofactor guanylyltransferase [Planctomycetaceae bacterium]|nr:molybdenum cofactor guanylyltransferase [Planctomycetaceae bacterium]
MLQNFSQPESPPPRRDRCGGIVLCGGQSRRMGQSKALLPFGAETCLQRVVRILGKQLAPIVIVASPNQELPFLPTETLIVHDPREGLGPLAGIALGLQHLSAAVDRAYISGCDVPLLNSEFVAHIISQLGDADVAAVRDGAFYHPLAGIYRTSLATAAWKLVEQNRLRAQSLIETAPHRDIPVDDLRALDPQLLSLQNMNTPDDYHRLLALAD